MAAANDEPTQLVPLLAPLPSLQLTPDQHGHHDQHDDYDDYDQHDQHDQQMPSSASTTTAIASTPTATTSPQTLELQPPAPQTLQTLQQPTPPQVPALLLTDLSTELLVHILKWTLVDFAAVPMPILVALAEVCVKLHNVVVSSPELWANVSLKVPRFIGSGHRAWFKFSHRRGFWKLPQESLASTYCSSYMMIRDVTEILAPSVVSSSLRTVDLAKCVHVNVHSLLLLLDSLPALTSLDISNTPGIWLRDLPQHLNNWSRWRAARRIRPAPRAATAGSPPGASDLSSAALASLGTPPAWRQIPAKLRLQYLNVHECGGIHGGEQHDDWDDFWFGDDFDDMGEVLLEVSDAFKALCDRPDTFRLNPTMCTRCESGITYSQQLNCITCSKSLPVACKDCYGDDALDTSVFVKCSGDRCQSRSCVDCAKERKCSHCSSWCCEPCSKKKQDSEDGDSDIDDNEIEGIFLLSKCAWAGCTQQLCEDCSESLDWSRCSNCDNRTYCDAHFSDSLIQCLHCRASSCRSTCRKLMGICKDCGGWCCKEGCIASHRSRAHPTAPPAQPKPSSPAPSLFEEPNFSLALFLSNATGEADLEAFGNRLLPTLTVEALHAAAMQAAASLTLAAGSTSDSAADTSAIANALAAAMTNMLAHSSVDTSAVTSAMASPASSPVPLPASEGASSSLGSSHADEDDEWVDEDDDE
ncbi:hypothetical protein BC831DRAFT_465533 [Entophlyctis helioformis]|nr:hypothetical protein BC831DRAFT_465533 [Entophlyctis helioformis]